MEFNSSSNITTVIENCLSSNNQLRRDSENQILEIIRKNYFEVLLQICSFITNEKVTQPFFLLIFFNTKSL